MSINKFTNNLDDATLHSNGFAEASKSNLIGATSSPQSFNQRLHIERNRTSVGGYHHSMLANGHHRNSHYQRADVAAPSVRPSSTQVSATRTNTGSTFATRRPGGLISDVTRPAPRQNFSEPPARGFNPYK